MKHLLKSTFVILALLSSTMIVRAQQMPPIPVDPNVRIGKLENGMTYYIRHNALPEKRADFYIAQKVGSILEEDNQRGLAHFLEHMCFNGTKNYPGDALKQYLEKIGVKFGENLNAYTSVDETVYNISNVPVTRDGIIDSCLLILHDWADDLLLDPKEIDSERGVIHEEWRTRTGAMMRMYEKTFPEIYQGSKYAYRLPIGTMEVVDNFPYQALRDYYEKWYRPDQQGLVIVGDIDVDKVEAKIKEMFSPIKMPASAAERVYFPVPDNKEPIITIATDKEQPNAVIMVSYKHDVIPNEQKSGMEYLLINYAKSMIAKMLNARYNELIHSSNPPFIYAEAYDDDFIVSKTKDAFSNYAVSKEDGIDNALATIIRETERIRRFGFTDSEYARAKADYLRQLESDYNERDKQKNEAYVDKYVRNFIDNEPIPGIENEYAIMNQIIPNIPAAMINQLVPEMISDSNLVVAIYGPEKEGLKYPSKEELLGVISQTKAENITAYQDKVSDQPLMASKPKAGKVVKTQEGPFGTTLLTLSNGVKVYIKKTDFKADDIQMKALSFGGNSLFPDSEAINIKAMNDVIELGGLGEFSVVDLEKVLAGKKAEVSAKVNTLTETLEGNCSPKDLETMLQLAYLEFTAPRMDTEAFKSFQARTKAALLNQEANPMISFVDSIQKGIYSGNPRAIRLKSDMIDQIDYVKIMDMYKDRFKDASDFMFILVGNIDAKEAAPLIAQYLGALPSTGRKETFKDVNMSVREGLYKNEFSKELQTPKASVFTIYSGKFPYNLKNSVTLDIFAQVMDLVYTANIREKEGGTYGVGIFGELQKYPKEVALLQIIFDTDPAKKDKMVEIAFNELIKFTQEGPSETDLAKVKEFMIKKYNEEIKENGYWAKTINDYLLFGMDMTTGYEKVVNSITAKDVQDFAKKMIDQNNRIEVIMSSASQN